MMRSLAAGVTGMRSHQQKMDVIGNNIANVNTNGFKAQRLTFAEFVAQNVRPSSRPSAAVGGTNPQQIGLGVSVGSIDSIFTQGSLDNTGIFSDIALDGDGFFVLRNGSDTRYTRAGALTFDSMGNLVLGATGERVQGSMGVNGVIPPLGTLQDIVIPQGLQSGAQATSDVSFFGNLDSRAAIGDTYDMQMLAYDSLGEQQQVTLTFTKTAANDWSWDAYDPGGALVNSGTVTFNPDGSPAAFVGGPINFVPTNGANALNINLNAIGAGPFDALTQLASTGSAFGRMDNGYGYGELQDLQIDRNGTVQGFFSNGEVVDLARIAIAQFQNNEGLARDGGSAWITTANSGEPTLRYADVAGSTVISGALEMSNVDLTQEFTQMITTQRGFQANSRVIGTADEMLQEAVNLKR